MRLHDSLLDRMTPYDLFRLAEDQFGEKDYYGAVATLERLLGESADTGHGLAAARELLARAYFHAAMLDKAEAASRALLDEEPDNGYAALLLGRTLQRQSRPEEAERMLARAEALGQGA
jgi:predicted Zn-dependent protease